MRMSNILIKYLKSNLVFYCHKSKTEQATIDELVTKLSGNYLVC